MRLAADEHMMLLVAHHIAWDDGSWRVFFGDLTTAYGGADLGPTPRPPAPGRRHRRGGSGALARSAGRSARAAGTPGPTGSAIPTGFRSQRTSLALAPETVTKVSALARETGATPYMVLLAAFGVLINRYTHTDDFLVASPVLNRGDRRCHRLLRQHRGPAAAPARPRQASATSCWPPVTPRWAHSPTSASTWIGWCAN